MFCINKMLKNHPWRIILSCENGTGDPSSMYNSRFVLHQLSNAEACACSRLEVRLKIKHVLMFSVKKNHRFASCM